MISFDDLLQYADNKFIEDMQKSLSKMQIFLIQKGVASSFREVKELPRIEIKGTSENEKERLLLIEVEDTFDVNDLECSIGFNTYYPIIKNGVIKCTTQRNGSFYTVFNVISETTDEFDLQLYKYIYIYYNQVFYLKQIVTVRKISKRSPLNPINRNQYDQITIKELFLNKYSRKELSEFTDEELDNVKNLIFNDIDTVACISQALSIFRVVNFVHESGQQLNIDFYNNEYYILKYLHNNSLLKSSSVNSLKDTVDHRYIEEIINMENSV